MLDSPNTPSARLAAFGLAIALSAASSAQVWRLDEWTGYGGNPQHTALSRTPVMPMQKILWSTPVDLNPQYSGNELLIHYSPPMVTFAGDVLVTVRTSSGGFEVQGRHAETGGLIFTEPTDYVLPPTNSWTPVCGPSLYGLTGMVVPGVGGTVYYRVYTGVANSAIVQWAFYGPTVYKANKAAYNNNVFICTPLTVDNAGNVYFGFRVNANSGTNLSSGIAKVTPSGSGTWISATAAAGSTAFTEPGMNCAPALSNDQSTLYIGLNGGGLTAGCLVGIDTATMKAKYAAPLFDPRDGNPATVPDISTASPMVGPDNDVYYGVLESPFYNSHGWMLHFDQTLSVTKTPGAFGWDDTAAVVPAQCVPSYMGTSSYLILTKYNNYAGMGVQFGGGTGINKVAVLDPNASTPATQNGLNAQNQGVPCMTPVISVTGPTLDTTEDGQYPGAVDEWCINSAAVDMGGKCAILNSEDGKCYLWNFVTNKLEQPLVLSSGLGEAYTSTVIGRFGVVFAINNARLYALGR